MITIIFMVMMIAMVLRIDDYCGARLVVVRWVGAQYIRRYLVDKSDQRSKLGVCRMLLSKHQITLMMISTTKMRIITKMMMRTIMMITVMVSKIRMTLGARWECKA